jgi:hypothetical protein
MLTKLISDLLAGSPSRAAEIPVNIAGVTCKLTVEQLLRLATPADSASAPAVHELLAHVVAGLTTGHVLVATGPTTFEFRKLADYHLPNPAGIDVTGNAATASRLLNPRQIAGVNFDGTQAIDIPHGNLSDTGARSHAEIDAHVEDATKHRVINDAGTLATDLWSAAQIIGGLATRASASHNHAGIYEPADANIQTHIADATKHRVINDAGTAATDLWSAAQIIAQLATKAAASHNHALATLSERAYASLTGRPSFFAIITVAGQSNVVADGESDTLTLAAGSGIVITTDPTTDTVTITNTGGGMPGAHGHTGPADGGTVAHTALTGVDTDAATTAIHHTLGTGANQAAPGNHAHNYLPLAGGALTGALTIAGSTAWHAGNDGDGSGLDADTVDGKHADELGSPALRILQAAMFGGF